MDKSFSQKLSNCFREGPKSPRSVRGLFESTAYSAINCAPGRESACEEEERKENHVGGLTKNEESIVGEEKGSSEKEAREKRELKMIVRNGCGVMEGVEERQQENGGGGVAAASSGGGMYVKVMTDEQMELLRRQISVYAAICEQLVEMHKAVTAQQDSIAGMRLGNMYCDPLMGGGHKISTRQRWTPSQMQLQILENIFEQGNGTPSKQKIKEITSELMQHGPISETNVYNWFQNRRARSKRKQQVGAPNNLESAAETEVESPKEKKAKVENIHSHEKPALHVDDMSYHGQEVSSNIYSLDPQSSKMQHTQSSDSLKSSGNLSPFSFFENMLANPRIEHIMGKMESQDFSPFHTSDGFNVIG